MKPVDPAQRKPIPGSRRHLRQRIAKLRDVLDQANALLALPEHDDAVRQLIQAYATHFKKKRG